jgi:hypothetical protein
VSYCLEATLTFDAADSASGEKRLAQLYDFLDKMESPNYFIGVSSRGLPETPSKMSIIRRKLRRWLDSLDYNQCVVWMTGEGKAAQLPHSESGVNFVFEAIPQAHLPP